ncbi:MAG: trigger factor [Thermodesulfovibrio sp.]|nr:trigger factor [Thermodesulfovibrio sp.]
MLKALEDISATKKRLKIEIPSETIESEIQKGLQDVQKKSKLPGFRPGKAPINIIEKKFGKNVEADVLEKVVPEFYMKALKEADLKPVSRPKMEEPMNFQRNVPFSMTLTVEVRPRIENLNYEGITVKDVPMDVKDDEVEAVLKNLAEEKGTYESTNDAVATDDLLTVDYTTEEGTDAKDVILKVGSGPYPEEFFDGLIGKKKDEEFELETSFPEDVQSPFAGKKPKFKIKIKEVKRRSIPPIDDELGKDLGFDNLQSLRDKARESILAAKNREADRIKQLEIVDKLVSSHEFEVPEGLVNEETEGMVSEIRAIGKHQETDEDLIKKFRPKAEKSVKASILLEMIGEKEGITVTEDDMKEEIFNFSSRFNLPPENVVKYYMAKDGSLDGLKNSIFEKKTLKSILSKANIEKGEQS